jgi:hypothetical protein
MRIRLARVAVATGVIAVFGCAGGCGGQPTGSGSPAAEQGVVTPEPPGGAIPVVDPGAIRYTCGRLQFGAEILTVVRHDETGANPFAAALRKRLDADDIDSNMLPGTGWTLVGQDAQGAEFVTSTGTGLMTASVGRVIGPAQEPFAVDGWVVDGWGGCQPERVLAAGLGNAEWALAPGQRVGPGTTTFDALVTERDCASGQSSEGRVVGPDIVAAGDQVLVTFAVRALGGGAQTCQGNPATRVTVTLPEPLGSRTLLDGSTLPPREPVAEP